MRDIITKILQFVFIGLVAYALLHIFLESAQANVVDDFGERLVWEDTKAASDLSDAGMYCLIAAPHLLALGHAKKHLVFGAAQLSVFGVTDVVKRVSKRTRPNGSDNRSFFSGHTSISASSAVLACSLSNRDNCILYLALATGVGYLRVAAHKHYLTDVLVGAGVGVVGGHYIPTLIFNF